MAHVEETEDGFFVEEAGLLSSQKLSIYKSRKLILVSQRAWLKTSTRTIKFSEVDYLKVSARESRGEDPIVFYELKLIAMNKEVVWSYEFSSLSEEDEKYRNITGSICKFLEISFHSKCHDSLEIPCIFCSRKISYLSKACLYCGKNLA